MSTGNTSRARSLSASRIRRNGVQVETEEADADEQVEARTAKSTIDWSKLLAKLNKFVEKRSTKAEGYEIYESFESLVMPSLDVSREIIDLRDRLSAYVSDPISCPKVKKREVEEAIEALMELIDEASTLHTRNLMAAAKMSKSDSSLSSESTSVNGETEGHSDEEARGGAEIKSRKGSGKHRNPETGFEAQAFEFVKTGVPMQLKQEEPLNGLNPKPSPEGIRLVREFVEASHNGTTIQASRALKSLYALANVDVRGDLAEVGIDRFGIHNIWNGSTVGESHSKGGAVESDDEEISFDYLPKIVDSEDELKRRFKAAQKIALRGEVEHEMSTWIERRPGRKPARIYVLPYSTHLALRKRQCIQRILIHNVGAFAKEEAATCNPKLRQKYAVLGAECDSLIQTERYTPDKTIDLSADDYNTIDVVAAHYLPNLFNGNNLLAEAAKIGEDKFRDNDVTDLLLPFLAKITLEPNESPYEKAKLLCDESLKLRKPTPSVNYGRWGFPVNSSTGRFVCTEENSIVCSIISKLPRRFANPVFTAAKGAQFFSEELFERAHQGDVSLSELKALVEEMDKQHVTHTETPGDDTVKFPSSVDESAAFHTHMSRGELRRARKIAAAAAASSTVAAAAVNSAAATPAVNFGGGVGSVEPTGVVPRGRDGKRGGGGKGGGKVSRERTQSASRAGEISGIEYYARTVELLGVNFERLPLVAELLCKYFTQTKGQSIFRKSGAGVFNIPLLLNDNFSWSAHGTSLNLDSRRDVYAAFQVIRDLMGPFQPNAQHSSKKLSKLGELYAAKNSHWKALLPAEFAACYRANPSAQLPQLRKIKIHGLDVLELCA